MCLLTKSFTNLIKNQSGVTLIEVVLAALLLAFFVGGFFGAFIGSKKVSRVSDVSSQVVTVAGNVLETLKQRQGVEGYYGSDLSDGRKTFKSLDEDATDDDVALLDGLNTEVGHNIEPIKKEYTVITYNDGTLRTRKDGFKKVTVVLEYEDEAKNTF